MRQISAKTSRPHSGGGHQAPDGMVQSIHRGLAILEEIAFSGNQYGVTELARKLGLNKTTVYRLLSTMEAKGYIEQNPETGRYGLGLRVLELGSAALNKMTLRSVALPFLEELMSRTNEAVNLVVLNNGEALYIEKVESQSTIRMHFQVGKRSPAHCTAVGKVLMASNPKDMERILNDKPLIRFTPNTITSQELLRDHLRQVAEQGYAIDDEEQEPGVRCIAAPVRDHTGRVVAAISVSGPVMRISRQRFDDLIPEIMATAEKISARLGYLRSPGAAAYPAVNR